MQPCVVPATTEASDLGDWLGVVQIHTNFTVFVLGPGSFAWFVVLSLPNAKQTWECEFHEPSPVSAPTGCCVEVFLIYLLILKLFTEGKQDKAI